MGNLHGSCTRLAIYGHHIETPRLAGRSASPARLLRRAILCMNRACTKTQSLAHQVARARVPVQSRCVTGRQSQELIPLTARRWRLKNSSPHRSATWPSFPSQKRSGKRTISRTRSNRFRALGRCDRGSLARALNVSRGRFKDGRLSGCVARQTHTSQDRLKGGEYRVATVFAMLFVVRRANRIVVLLDGDRELLLRLG